MNRNVALTVLLTAFLLPACRSRVKPVASPTPLPASTAVAEAPSQRVEAPARDFAPPPPSPTDEIASTEISELNRLAHERGWIRDAFFDYDRNSLRTDAEAALAGSAQWLQAHPEIAVTLEGHCDERGTEQYNLALGDRRAHTAREYLVTLGIDGRRLSTVSYGEERPFADGSGEESWSQNRRAHFVLRRQP
jgi:peptidoglycan-associated lipoprotein